MAINPFVIKIFQNLSELHVPFSVATNMPFVTCDQETYNDQSWLFTSLEDVKEFAQTYAAQKMVFRDVLVKKEQFKDLFVDFHSMGVNEIVFCEGKTQHKLELSEIIQFKDNLSIPPLQRPLMNQELQLSTIYFLQEVRKAGVKPDREKLEPLAEEMYANLVRAHFLLPVMVETTEDKKDKLLFPIITDKKGNKFQPVFSDHIQFQKYARKNKPEANSRILLVDLNELQKYLSPQTQGYMLNPDGYCHILTMQQLKFLSEHFK